MVSAKDSLGSLRINPLRLQFEVFRREGVVLRERRSMPMRCAKRTKVDDSSA